VAGGARLPPPPASKNKDAAAAAAAAPRNDKGKDAEAVAAARLARAAAAGATLRRLAAGPPARVTLRTVYVRGFARETRTWRLRQLLSAVAGLPERAVVDVDRLGDLAAVRLLAPHADAFEAAVALSPAADTLTLLRGVDPLSPSLLGAPRRRGLTAEAARETARAFFVTRTTAKLASLAERAGMPPAHREALRQLLHRELAPRGRQLAEGGAVAGRRLSPAMAAPDVTAARLGGAGPRVAVHDCLVPPVAGAVAETVDADRRANENFLPAASTPAAPTASTSEISVPPRIRPTFSDAGDGDTAAAEIFRSEADGADMAIGVGKQLVTTTVTEPTPGSGRTPPAFESTFSAAVTPAGTLSAARAPRSVPLADAVAAAVGRAPGGAVGALSLAAAFFRVASSAVAEAIDAASAPRHLNPAAMAAGADVAETRGVRVTAAAAATAATGLCASGAAPSHPQPPQPAPARVLADVAGARLAEAAARRAAARMVAAYDTPLAVARRLRAAASAGAARGARRVAAGWAADAARADAAAAALVCLPPDPGQRTGRFSVAAGVYTPPAGARAPPPTPASKRRVRPATNAASAALRAGVAGVGPVGVSGRTRAAALRRAAPAVAGLPCHAAEAVRAAAPAGVCDAAGVFGAPRASVDFCILRGGVLRRSNLTVGVLRAPPAPYWTHPVVRRRLWRRWRPRRRILTRCRLRRPLFLLPPLATPPLCEFIWRWLAGIPRGRSAATPSWVARFGTEMGSLFSFRWDPLGVGRLADSPRRQ